YLVYMKQVQKNAAAMANYFMERDYNVVSGGTDNHMLLIDLRNKELTGKEAEDSLVKANITVNKNMVPFDTQSPFVTSGIRIGTPAVTTRGLKENDMETIVAFIDEVLKNRDDHNTIDRIKKEVGEMMQDRPLFSS